MSNSDIALKAAIGTVLSNPELADELRAALTEQEIYSYDLKIVYRAIFQLREKGLEVDKASVISILPEDFEGLSVVEDCMTFSNPARFEDHISLAKQRALLVTIDRVCDDTKESLLHDHRDTPDIALSMLHNKVEGLLNSSAPDKSTTKSVKEYLPSFVAGMKARAATKDSINGLRTGIDKFDKITSGLQDTDLIIVAARPSMGKTTAVLNWMSNIAKNRGKVMIFSIEMPMEQLMDRLVSQISGIDMNKIKSGKLNDMEMGRFASAIEIINDLDIVIDEDSSLNPTEMRLKILKEQQNGPIAAVMVDYLQLMNGKDGGFGPENKTLEIGYISRSLKKMAKDFSFPMVALAQLNRSLEQRADKRPVNSDLRDSGSIEQDADIIMFIYRDEVYNEDTPDKGIAEFILGKHRNGSLGTVKTKFEGAKSRFVNLTGIDDSLGNEKQEPVVINTPPSEGYQPKVNPQESLIDLDEIPM